MPLGENLMKKGLITKEQLEAALAQQKKDQEKRLGAILVVMGFVSDAQVEESL
jgi:type IV pilus assembly protein PilB